VWVLLISIHENGRLEVDVATGVICIRWEKYAENVASCTTFDHELTVEHCKQSHGKERETGLGMISTCPVTEGLGKYTSTFIVEPLGWVQNKERAADTVLGSGVIFIVVTGPHALSMSAEFKVVRRTKAACTLSSRSVSS
jgi:hypothetical protein